MDYAYVTIQVRVFPGMEDNPAVAAEIAVAAQDYVNETFGRPPAPGE
jgi:hypothetical protein